MAKRKRHNAIKDSDDQETANGSSNKTKHKVTKEISKDADISVSLRNRPFLKLKRIEENIDIAKQRKDVKSAKYANDANEDSENSSERGENIAKTRLSKNKLILTKKSSKESSGLTKQGREVKSISYAEDSNEEESGNEDDSDVETKMQSKSKLKPNKQSSKKNIGIAKQRKDVKSNNYASDSNEEDNDNSCESMGQSAKNKLKHTEKSPKKNSGLTKHGREVNSIDYADYFSSEESNNSNNSEDFSLENIKDLRCYFCGTTFKTYLSLKSHMRLHRMSFKCTICIDNGTFKERPQYMNHMKVFHPEIGPYPCDYPKCSKNFDKVKELRAHMKSHQPFMCKFCKKNFAKQRFMKLHVQKNHLS